MVFSPKFWYFYYGFAMHICFIIALVFLSAWVPGIHYIPPANKYASQMKHKDFLIQKSTTFSFMKNWVSDLKSSYCWHHPHCKGQIPPPRNTQSRDAMGDTQKKQSHSRQQHPSSAHRNVARTIRHMLSNRHNVLHGLHQRSITFRAFTTESDCWEAEPCPLMLAGSFAEQ